LKTYLLISLLYICLVWGLNSCQQIRDLDRIRQSTLNPRLAVPVAQSIFGFDDFITNTDSTAQFITDEDGLLILLYQNESLVSQDASSFLELPDESASESFSFDAPILIQLPIQFEISAKETYSFDFETDEGDQIDSVLLRSGELALTLNATFPAFVEVNITFTSLLENVEFLRLTFESDTVNNAPKLDISEILYLSDLKLDLTNGGTTINTFQYELEIILKYNGQSVGTHHALNIEVGILDAAFNAIYGRIATRTITSEAQTIKLDFFNNLPSGTFFLDEPAIRARVGNSFGVPASIDLTKLHASNDSETRKLTGAITQPQIINAPTINQQGESVETIISIDHTNSNLPDLISMLPTEIIFQYEGMLNPEGKSIESFILYESIIDIDLEIELPLFGRVSDLQASKQFEFNGTDIVDNIDFVLFQVYTNNGFPLAADIQIDFLDAAGNILESLIEEDERLMEAAPVGSDGIVTSPAENTLQISVDEDQLTNIQDATDVRIEVVFNTTGNGTTSVKILESYKLEVKLGVQTEFEITIGG